MTRRDTKIRSIYRLLADHPTAKYCVHDINKIYGLPVKTASTLFSKLVRKGGATKVFKQTCETQKIRKHYHYRFLGKIKTNGSYKKKNGHKKGYGAVSRHLQQKVNELQSENRKLRTKVDALKEMLRDEWINE